MIKIKTTRGKMPFLFLVLLLLKIIQFIKIEEEKIRFLNRDDENDNNTP